MNTIDQVVNNTTHSERDRGNGELKETMVNVAYIIEMKLKLPKKKQKYFERNINTIESCSEDYYILKPEKMLQVYNEAYEHARVGSLYRVLHKIPKTIEVTK